MEDKFKRRMDEADEFWTLGETLPQKRSRGRFSDDTDTVIVEIGEISEDHVRNADISERAIPTRRERPQPSDDTLVPTYKPVPLLDYVVENSLIKHVTVWKWPSKYKFYERFAEDARRFYPLEGSECEYVPFMSYSPQYVQLSDAQLKWYLWWRSCVRRGEYPKTGQAYIMLFICELINTPELTSPSDAAAFLIALWNAYRDDFPAFFNRISEVVCDLCLIHRLVPPRDIIGMENIGEFTRFCSLREFYYSDIDVTADSDAFADLLIGYSGGCSWHKSRYYTGEYAAAMDEHIPKALRHAVGVLAKAGEEHFSGSERFVRTTVSRNTFGEMVCIYDVKRRIDVEYLSFTRSPELRFIFTDMVKYAENGVRAMMKIKSRLSAPNLTEKFRSAVDSYFAPYAEAEKRAKAEAAIPEYERRYEAASKTLSLSEAIKLEDESWEVAKALGGFDEVTSDPEVNEQPITVTEPTTDIQPPENDTVSYEAYPEQIIRGLRLAADGKSDVFAAYAESLNMFADTLAEQINEALYDIIGDAAVEDIGGGYVLVEDYRAEINEILESQSERFK